MTRLRLCGLLLCLLPLSLPAQEETDDPCRQTMDKTSQKMFRKARDLQKSGKKDEANELYEAILDEHPEYMEPNYYYALGYYLPLQANKYQSKRKDKSDVAKALAAFNRIYDVCPYYRPHFNLYAARIAYFSENFSEAVKFASVITENQDLFKEDKDLPKIEEAELIIERSRFFDNILKNPVPFDPKPVAGISTTADEYLGTLSPDGEYFYFTRRTDVPDNSPFGHGERVNREFFSSSRKRNGQFGAGTPLPYPFNLTQSEGSPTVNITNDFLVFTKLVSENNGYPNYDLYYSELIDGDWTAPKSLGANINRPDSWESQASLSSDGKVLFFASDRPGTLGGSDIWYAERNSDGIWRKPVNLGPTINTKGNERSPFLHTDSRTLYFSSSGHDGMGGQDIFYSKLDEKTRWAKPVNIGHPINSERDEFNFFVSLDGKTGYFSSNKIENKDWNIYSFDLYEEARPHGMMIVKGQVEADDGDLAGATVEIVDTAAKVIATGVVNENTGHYAVATEVQKKEDAQPLIVNIKKEGHSYDAQLITPEDMEAPVVTKNAEVKAIETGKVCDLHDIHFETNSYGLTRESQFIVSLFVRFLKENPTLKVEIQGHTDAVGNDRDNLILSENRAKSVYDYVVRQGIPACRLRYKGYGESMPVASNDTAAGRAKNRRTVFLIYDK